MKVKLSNKDEYFIIDDSDLHFLEDLKWSLSKVGYVCARSKSKDGNKIILLHRRIMQATKSQMIDHADGNTLNNSRSNLRFCDKSKNAMNMKKRVTSNSPFKGIYRHKYGWCASIKMKGKKTYLGFRKDPVDAAVLYDIAARKMFGEFARLNFPEIKA